MIPRRVFCAGWVSHDHVLVEIVAPACVGLHGFARVRRPVHPDRNRGRRSIGQDLHGQSCIFVCAVCYSCSAVVTVRRCIQVVWLARSHWMNRLAHQSLDHQAAGSRCPAAFQAARQLRSRSALGRSLVANWINLPIPSCIRDIIVFSSGCCCAKLTGDR